MVNSIFKVSMGILSLLVVVLGYLAWQGSPDSEQFERFEDARKAAKDGELEKAEELADAIVDGEVISPMEYRLAAQIYVQVGREADALDAYLDSFNAFGETDDLLAWFPILSKRSELQEVLREIDALPEDTVSEDQRLRFRGLAYVDNKEFTKAYDALATSLSISNKAEDLNLLGRVMDASRSQELRKQFIKELEARWEDEGELGLAAMRQIIARNVPVKVDIEEFAKRLTDAPNAQRVDKISALKLQAKLPDANVDAVVNALVELYDLENDPDDQNDLHDMKERRDFAMWLNSHNKWAITEKLIPENLAFSDTEFLHIRANALAGLQQWDALTAMLENSNVPATPGMLDRFAVRAHVGKGETKQAIELWIKSLQQAGNNDALLQQFQQYSERFLPFEFSLYVLDRRAALENSSTGTHVELIRRLRLANQLDAICLALDRAVERFPGEIAFENDRMYYRLLRGDAADAFVEPASAIVEGNPNLVPPRLTYALALFKSGRQNEAAHVIQTKGESFAEAPLPMQVVAAGIMRSVNGNASPINLPDDLDTRQLLKAEAAMLP